MIADFWLYVGRAIESGELGTAGLRGRPSASATRKNLIWVMPAEETMTRTNPLTSLIAGLIGLTVVIVVATSCGDDDNNTGDEPVTITLVTHDSFEVSDEIWTEFTAQTGIEVELLEGGDTGRMVSEAILTAGNPLGDVMFGVDNTFLARALNADLFEPYESPNLADVPAEFVLDEQHRVTPIDFGDVCINYWTDALTGDPPSTLEDLTAPEFADQLVVQSPETSSPGLAFLLATIAGTDDWEQFWAELADNGVAVAAGWEDAYYGEFIAGEGDRPMVVSYASSPPAEVVYADPPVDTAPTEVLLDSCFRQIEFAGVLSGTEHPEQASALIDFMLTPAFQNDIPLNMFVFPVAESAALPQVFVDHAQIAEEPHSVDPDEIEARRDEWTDRWVEIVLG